MTARPVDRERLRRALRRLSRGNLLIIAERATELVAGAKLQALVGDFVRLHELPKATDRAAGLLDEVRKFHAASLGGEYYESFDVDSKNFMQKSQGTEAFIAELDRLVNRCVRANQKGSRAQVREAFELLFGLLRHIDECHDDVIFFADEAWVMAGRRGLAGRASRLFPVPGRFGFARGLLTRGEPGHQRLCRVRAATAPGRGAPRRQLRAEGSLARSFHRCRANANLTPEVSLLYPAGIAPYPGDPERCGEAHETR